MNKLQICCRCGDKSLRVKVYYHNGIQRRVGFCINKGCRWKINLPVPNACVGGSDVGFSTHEIEVSSDGNV